MDTIEELRFVLGDLYIINGNLSDPKSQQSIEERVNMAMDKLKYVITNLEAEAANEALFGPRQ